jgi:hypothetical protein
LSNLLTSANTAGGHHQSGNANNYHHELKRGILTLMDITDMTEQESVLKDRRAENALLPI